MIKLSNSLIIGTSTFWRFEFTSGLILLTLMLPLNWQLTRYLGILGPAISNLVSFSIYNLVRYLFLWNKFKMQPFTWKSLYTVGLAAACYGICFWLFDAYTGMEWMLLRSSLFLLLFITGMILLKLSPDILPVWETVKKKLKFGN